MKERGYHFLKKEGVTTWEKKCFAAPAPLYEEEERAERPRLVL